MKTTLFWRASLLIFGVARNTWALVSPTDICSLVTAPMFCTCDLFGPNQAHTVSCFIFSAVTPEHSVWDGFAQQQKIRSLTLTSRINSSLTFIPSMALRKCLHLENVVIHDGHLQVLWPYSFVNMSHLQNISLERNDIGVLELFAFSYLPNLTKIVLSENYIRRLPAEAFYRLPKMKHLYLDRNNLSQIDDMAFVDLSSLEELELNDNFLEDLTYKTFSGLGNLKRLDLCRNKLRKLSENIFSSLSHLNDLDLHDNLIEDIDGRAFQGLNHLSALKLQYNRIKELPDNIFRGVPNLMVVDLTRNRLQAFRKEILKPLSYSRKLQFVVFLKENNLQCNCDIIWISEHFQQSSNIFFRREARHLKCKRNNTHVRISKLSALELGCSETTSLIQKNNKKSITINAPQKQTAQPFVAVTNYIDLLISTVNISDMKSYEAVAATEKTYFQVESVRFQKRPSGHNWSVPYEMEARSPEKVSSSSAKLSVLSVMEIVILWTLLWRVS